MHGHGQPVGSNHRRVSRGVASTKDAATLGLPDMVTTSLAAEWTDVDAGLFSQSVRHKRFPRSLALRPLGCQTRLAAHSLRIGYLVVLSGYDTTWLLRKHGEQIPVIALTAMEGRGRENVGRRVETTTCANRSIAESW